MGRLTAARLALTVRDLAPTVEDAELLMAARQACRAYLPAGDAPDEVDDFTVLGWLRYGHLQGLVAERGGRFDAMLCYLNSGEEAQVCLFHRAEDAPREGLRASADLLYTALRARLRKRGVSRISCHVDARHPRLARLLTFYRRYALTPDRVRLAGKI